MLWSFQIWPTRRRKFLPLVLPNCPDRWSDLFGPHVVWEYVLQIAQILRRTQKNTKSMMLRSSITT